MKLDDLRGILVGLEDNPTTYAPEDNGRTCVCFTDLNTDHNDPERWIWVDLESCVAYGEKKYEWYGGARVNLKLVQAKHFKPFIHQLEGVKS